jgi:phosphoglycolate phosphatase
MREIDLFIFDLDGTLIESSRDIANAVNFTLRHLGEPVLSESEISRNVGDGVLNLLRRCLVENHQDRVTEAVKIFRQHYGEHLTEHTTLYPGVKETLEHFGGKRSAILTNKPERYIPPILQALRISERIQFSIGGDGKIVPKPGGEAVRKILKHFGVEAGKAVMVGDSAVDVETGKLGDILTCAVTFGYRPRKELEAAEPDFIIDRFEELMEIFY